MPAAGKWENVLSLAVRLRDERQHVVSGGPKPRFARDERPPVQVLARFKEIASGSPAQTLDLSARDLGGAWGDFKISSEAVAGCDYDPGGGQGRV